jgi:hypothetical protein
MKKIIKIFLVLIMITNIFSKNVYTQKLVNKTGYEIFVKLCYKPEIFRCVYFSSFTDPIFKISNKDLFNNTPDLSPTIHLIEKINIVIQLNKNEKISFDVMPKDLPDTKSYLFLNPTPQEIFQIEPDEIEKAVIKRWTLTISNNKNKSEKSLSLTAPTEKTSTSF